MSFLPDDAFLHLDIVWCMKFKKALNKEKNTPVIRRNENGLKLKLIITSFNIRLLTLQKKVSRHSVNVKITSMSINVKITSMI